MNPQKMVYGFVFLALAFFGLFVGSAAMRQGWFSPSVDYIVEFPSGNGLNIGTSVLISGLKAGQVKSIDLNSENKILVLIRLQKKYALHVKEDSKAILGRTFIIGEKVISLTTGNSQSSPLKELSVIQGEESLEITDLLSGGRLAPYFKTFNSLMEQLRMVIEGDGATKTISLVDFYREFHQSLKLFENVSTDMHLIRTEFAVSPDTKKLIRDLANSTELLKSVLAKTESGMSDISSMSREMVKMTPELSKTLSETVFTLQALQRSFILSGGVARLKDEKSKSDKDPPQRTPASQ